MPAVVLDLPFTGLWLTQNSPAARVPSHGTDLFGTTYAIDFVAADCRRRTAARRDWRTLLGTEPVDRFLGFGRPILSPADGVVAAVHDAEPDHPARRSQLALVPYALGQGCTRTSRHGGRCRQPRDHRARAGRSLHGSGRPAARFDHRRAGPGRGRGQPLGSCGNSGNSTQPHVHVQVTDTLDFATARGVPMAFRRFHEWPRGSTIGDLRESGLPAEGSLVEPEPPAPRPGADPRAGARPEG